MAAKVQLYLYDLSNGLAANMSLQLTGKYLPAVWHSSVVVFGEEIYYGQGILQCKPGQSHHGAPLRVIELGETHIDKDTFHEYLRELQALYTADNYHLTDFNCNTFTNDVSNFLTGNSIPQEVIDLPKEFLSTPFGASLRPMIDNMFRRPGGRPLPQAGNKDASPLPGGLGVQNALQQVAAAAQAGPSMTNGLPSAVESAQIQSSLTAPTSLTSFTSLLQSNRCVAAMFTADWCGPCKTIKPTFQELAKRPTTEAPIAFALIDSNAGQEIVQHFRISAFPTFIFFLRGVKLHELRGADVGELRTQVAILAMSGYPAHSHKKLNLPLLQGMSTAPVLFEQRPNFEAALSKLQSSVESEGDTSVISAFRAATTGLQRDSLSASEAQQFVAAARNITRRINPAKLFPVLDILKFAILSESTAKVFASTLDGGETFHHALLARLVKEELPKPTLLTLLRLLSNSLSSPILASSLLSLDSSRRNIVQILIKALLADDSSTRACAAALAYSVVGWTRQQRKIWIDEDCVGKEDFVAEEEFETELCTAFLESLDRENDAEVAYRLVAALGGLMLYSPHFESSLSPIAQALEGKRIVQSKTKLTYKTPNVDKLIKEVSELIETM